MQLCWCNGTGLVSAFCSSTAASWSVCGLVKMEKWRTKKLQPRYCPHISGKREDRISAEVS